MEQFLKQLQTIPEVAELIRRVEDGGCPGGGQRPPAGAAGLRGRGGGRQPAAGRRCSSAGTSGRSRSSPLIWRP